MVNEWTKVELYGANNDGGVRRFTIADGASISKGTLLALIDPRTASAALIADVVFAGVASEEHLPNVGITDISVWTDGIFKCIASGAVTIGTPVTGGETSNTVIDVLDLMTGAASGALISDVASIIGVCYDAVTDAETTVRLRL